MTDTLLAQATAATLQPRAPWSGTSRRASSALAVGPVDLWTQVDAWQALQQALGAQDGLHSDEAPWGLRALMAQGTGQLVAEVATFPAAPRLEAVADMKLARF